MLTQIWPRSKAKTRAVALTELRLYVPARILARRLVLVRAIFMSDSKEELKGKVRQAAAHLASVRAEVQKLIVGQQGLIDRLLICLIARGHVLLEGLPGLAKTSTINALARSSHCSFARIQFTPDLLPADITGTLIYDPLKGTYSTRTGPIFANLVLADEINRAPSKVQSALLEAMQEHQVTIGDQTFPLPEPFLVLATQNPIEQEGTYPLPEAQMDRFMLKVRVGYPSREEELQIMDRVAGQELPRLTPVVSPEQLLRAQRVVSEIYIDAKVKEYIVSVVLATRDAPAAGLADLAGYIEYGASPR